MNPMGFDVQECQEFAGILGCHVEKIPFKYLGVQIGGSPKRIATWDPIVSNFRKKLASWKGKHLSLGGRIILIKTALSAIPLFYMSVYRAPKKVIKRMEQIRRSFFVEWVS